MAKCLVVGGGFAGLSTAVFLAEKGHEVKLIEASPKLGGRAYSFRYEKQNCIVDNGQHILMGCYYKTLRFFRLIGSLDNIEIQSALKINFLGKGGVEYELDTEGVTYPFNILSALKNYDALSNSEKYSVVKLFLKIAMANPKHYASKTTLEFLQENHQSQNTINALWEVIHVGTMNCALEESGAEIFVRILKQIFFTVDESTKIILPRTSLSEMYCEQSRRYLEARNGSIELSDRLLDLEFDEGNSMVTKVKTSKSIYNDFDIVVMAIPPHQIERILSHAKMQFTIPDFQYSQILNVHLWMDKNPFERKFYGLINSDIHWIFNHNTHLNVVTSAASKFMEWRDDQIIELCRKELDNYFPSFKSVKINDFLILKEKRATFIPSVQNTIDRSKLSNNVGNLFFAGDWTNTQFPATIEGAVKSGFTAAQNVSDFLK